MADRGENREMTGDRAVWDEYDSAAIWCARHGYTGDVGSPLPALLSTSVKALIDADPEAFAQYVKATAYMVARAQRAEKETAARRFTGTAEAFALAYPDLARRSVVVTRLSGWDTVRTYKVFMDRTAMWKWLNTGNNSRDARPVVQGP